MAADNNKISEPIWIITQTGWALLAAVAVTLAVTFYEGLEELVTVWGRKEEYGHGYLIPFITIFFIWQKKNILETIPFEGSWLGVALMLMGGGLFVLGDLSTLFIIVQYSFLMVLYGLVLAIAGWKIVRQIWVPLLFLVFMIPLPNFVLLNLSAYLQLISSELGVAFIRLFDISVYLEGNVIDLGAFQLQVVEACSGLRYLFPLTSLAFMAAYIFKAALWKRALVFLSSIPITILMNSFRIGVIGILVDSWGISHAEGFLHYFEGWIIFMGCMLILLLEIVVLAKIGKNSLTLSEAFALDFPEPSLTDVPAQPRKFNQTFVAASISLAIMLTVSVLLEDRQEIIPQRNDFSSFPDEVNGWKGNRRALGENILDSLDLDDYIMSDYLKSSARPVNFYVAYYDSQGKDESAHSPRTCIPGGGWQIRDLAQRQLSNITVGDTPLVVNRLVIRKGDVRQLVYYWFQGRSRIITNEYLVKWYLFWDALTMKRTDGALVRLTVVVNSDEDLLNADEQLVSFAKDFVGLLNPYIPE